MATKRLATDDGLNRIVEAIKNQDTVKERNAEIDAHAKEVMDSLPSDYTNLVNQVEKNKADIKSLTEDVMLYRDDIVIYDNHIITTISGINKITEDNGYFIALVPVNNYVAAYFNSLPTNNLFGVFNESFSKLYINTCDNYNNGNHKGLSSYYLNMARTYENGFYIGITFSKNDISIENFTCNGIKLKNKSIKDYGQFAEICPSDNLFNIETNWHPMQAYANVAIQFNDKYLSSDLIEIDSSRTYYSSFYANNIDNFCLSCIDNNLNYIGRVGYNTTSYENFKGITFPESTKYVCICRKSDYSWHTNGSIEPDETDYISETCYKKIPEISTLPYKSIEPNRINGIYTHLWTKPQNTSVYYRDKKFVFEGDSLTAMGSGNIYAVTTCRELGITNYVNVAVGGTAIEGESSLSINSDNRINKYPLDTDYIVAMFGTNGVAEMGDLTYGNHDINTFIGAINVWLSKIYYKYRMSEGYYKNVDYTGITRVDEGAERDIKIVLITPPQKWENFDADNDTHASLDKVLLRGEAMIKMSRYWGIPCLDSMTCMHSNPFNEAHFMNENDKTHFPKRMHFLLADGLIGLLRCLEPIEHDGSITTTTKL